MIARRAVFVLALALLPLPAAALDPTVPAAGLPSATEFSSRILPERPDVVSWKALAQVEPVKQGDRMVPQFAKPVLALDAREQRVQGFMIPLDLGDRQKHFLLSAVPPHCGFCLPAGPEAIVEVRSKEGVPYAITPIVVAGRFAVLKDDPNGILYRLSDATQVDVAKVAPSAPPGIPGRPGTRN
jgi:hypothetical protein